MVGHKLAVQKRESSDNQARDEPCKCYLRGIIGAGEHAFSAKSAADNQAI